MRLVISSCGLRAPSFVAEDSSVPLLFTTLRRQSDVQSAASQYSWPAPGPLHPLHRRPATCELRRNELGCLSTITAWSISHQARRFDLQISSFEFLFFERHVASFELLAGASRFDLRATNCELRSWSFELRPMTCGFQFRAVGYEPRASSQRTRACLFCSQLGGGSPTSRAPPVNTAGQPLGLSILSIVDLRVASYVVTSLAV